MQQAESTWLLVGRPNVGKSTLFNRLSGTREAIVLDLPGVTRDYLCGEIRNAGLTIRIVDTPGWTEAQTDLEKASRAQWMKAYAACNVQLLFVVDGKTGILPEDMSILQEIRRFNRPIYLVINKSEDSKRRLEVAFEYCELGLEPHFFVSATHGTGIEELRNALITFYSDSGLEKTKSAILPERETKATAALKVAIVGRPNAGKSTLINQLLGKNRCLVSDLPGTTRDTVVETLLWGGYSIALMDTAGLRRRSRVSERIEKVSSVKSIESISNADLILFLFDLREGPTDQDLRLIRFALKSNKGLIILGNKLDGLTGVEKRRAIERASARLKFAEGIPIHYLSALTGKGKSSILPLILKVWKSAEIALTPAKATRLLEAAVEGHPPPIVGSRRIRIKHAQLLHKRPPTLVFYGNQLQELPESYRRYLVNYYKKALQWVGFPVISIFKTAHNPYVHNSGR